MDQVRQDRGAPEALALAVEHAHHVLPSQGPIGNFIHHNTLHAYQHLPFHDAIRAAWSLHDAEGYLAESHYRDALESGRIADSDLTYALSLRAREVPDQTLGPITRRTLERLILRHGLPGSELADELVEAAPTRRALFAACERLAPLDAAPHAALLARVGKDRTLRDLLIALDARCPAELTNPLLIDFLCAYLDEGMARWTMPGRERGLLACFVDYLRVAPHSLYPFQRRALSRLERGLTGQVDPEAAAGALCLTVLAELGVAPSEFEAYVCRALLELPGFSGIVSRLEQVPSDRSAGAPPVSLLQLTAMRLVLDAEACSECASDVGFRGPLARLPDFAAARFAREPRTNRANASALFVLCELAGLTLEVLETYGAPFVERACATITALDELTRRRLLHEAYERAHLREILDALSLHRAARTSAPKVAPRFQALFCIDDREESIRRYFEELHPGHRTYGVAGFFGLAMRFRGIDDASDTALCPVVVTPGHAIEEAALPEHEATLARRFSRRNAVARVRFELADSSRSLVRGVALTPLLGTLAAIPLTLRVLFPRLSSRLARWVSTRALPKPRTQLKLERLELEDRVESALARGFTLDEQAERVAGTLENVGLVREFAPLVAVLGHGASTVNNPHHSAYDCGACGGRNGGPNGRAFAAMANDPRVRERLRVRGIDIPHTTWFVGGFHDTTTDGVHLADLERVPPQLAGELRELLAALDEARAQSALERCRKFEHAPRTLTPETALRHVEERAVDLSQARPELGHATNAVCIVGRRGLSEGLFLDRRAFLVSYDADIDGARKILARILGAAVPVGAGINLEYYFSTVDNVVWGSGTKLPHNLAGLLGVQEGSSGDLRTGLPRQMIEIHDPVRLLSVIEASPESILAVAANNPELTELVTKEWVRVASVHPETGAISVFENGGFQPYVPSATSLATVASAEAWYRGQLGFLPPVRILKRSSRAA